MSERCEKLVGDDRHRCGKPARYVFSGSYLGATGRVYPMRRALCVLHSGKGYLSEGALPGWVNEVIDLKDRVDTAQGAQ